MFLNKALDLSFNFCGFSFRISIFLYFLNAPAIRLRLSRFSLTLSYFCQFFKSLL